jgi:hypothetical protein
MMNPHRGWLFAFGLCASLTALSRWSSSFYLLSFAALAFPLALSVRTRAGSQSIASCLATAILGSLPGIVFLFGFWQENSWYYRTFGFAFGAPIANSILWTSKAIVTMLGAPLLVVFLAFTLWSWRRLKDEAQVVATCSWLPVAIFFFVCFIVKAVDGYHPLVYFAPALAVSAFGALKTPRNLGRPWSLLGLGLIALSFGVGVHSYERARKTANTPSPAQALQKSTDVALANLILETGSRCFTEFDTESVRPQMETFFFHNRFCKPVSYFSIHESYLRFIYETANPQQMAERAFKKVKERVELVAVFADPDDALHAGVFNNRFSAAVSQGVSQRVPADPNFHFVGQVKSPAGTLAVYKNSSYRSGLPD